MYHQVPFNQENPLSPHLKPAGPTSPSASTGGLEELRDLSAHQKAELEQSREHIEHLMSAVERREKIIREHEEETQVLLFLVLFFLNEEKWGEMEDFCRTASSFQPKKKPTNDRTKNIYIALKTFKDTKNM